MDLQVSDIVSGNPLLSSMDSIQEVIDQGTINSKDHMGSTFLHRAAREGHVEIVEKLLESGASVCLEDLYGHLPLHVASMSGHPKIVQLLLNQDCDALDKMSSTKLSPLHCAAKEGKLEVVKLLLERGASLNVQNSYGHTPLMLAVSEDYIDVVRLLVDAGADLFVRDKSTLCVFHLAISKGSPRCLQVLLDKVAQGKLLDHTNIHGLSPYQSALVKLVTYSDSYTEIFEKMKMLIKAGASPRLAESPRTFHMMKVPSVFEKLVISGNVDAVSLILQTNVRKHILKEVSGTLIKLTKGTINSASKDMEGLLQDYLGDVGSLHHLCRMVIRENIDPRYQSICQLPLPQNLKNYLAFSDLC